ncbi:hypothetical protein T440DRAFT_76531 [Plenodomus tracheiphilus IPT5]|uniref:Uncharacterized protein n=1 Tax=Plenodomus tracheiphilus IPT5 TaxID=1408161 RepID=A0A6A7B632_9PLEO|nr:hypothetical protein T440DRAFT_76531 [Plenodomus tracheiphilus IPT5]
MAPGRLARPLLYRPCRHVRRPTHLRWVVHACTHTHTHTHTLPTVHTLESIYLQQSTNLHASPRRVHHDSAHGHTPSSLALPCCALPCCALLLLLLPFHTSVCATSHNHTPLVWPGPPPPSCDDVFTLITHSTLARWLARSSARKRQRQCPPTVHSPLAHCPSAIGHPLRQLRADDWRLHPLDMAGISARTAWASARPACSSSVTRQEPSGTAARV